MYGSKKRFLAFILECFGFFVLKPLVFLAGRKSTKEFNILLIEPFQMGDVVALSVLLGPLRKKFPTAKIYILGKKGPVQIAKFLSEVEGVLHASFPWSVKNGETGSWLTWFSEMWALQKYGFTIGIDVRGDVRSHLSLLLAGCTQIISYKQYIYSDIFNHGLICDVEVKEGNYQHIFERHRFLLKGLGIPEKDLFPIQFPLFRYGEIQPDKKETPSPILLHIGASWEFKMWPFAHWAGIIRQLSSHYSIPILIVAGPGEEHLVEGIRKLLKPQEMPEVCFPNLEELIRLLQNCRLIIGCDSGPMCIANCLDIPRIALFGPGLPEVWKPYTKTSYFLQAIEGYDCYPCILKVCVRPESSCISQVKILDVFTTAKTILDGVPA